MQTILFFNDNDAYLGRIREIKLKHYKLFISSEIENILYYLEEFIPEYLILNCRSTDSRKILKNISKYPELKVIIMKDIDEEDFKYGFKELANNIFIKQNSGMDDLLKLLNTIDEIGNYKNLYISEEISANSSLSWERLHEIKYLKQELISFYSVQGGTGRTTLSLNLAFAIKNIIKNAKILFLDLNFSEGCTDSAIKLGQEQINNLTIFIDKISEIPKSFYQAVTNIDDAGIDFIFPPRSLFKSDSLDIDMLNELVFEARREYNIMIVDLPNRYDNIFIEMLNLSTIIFLVSSPEINQVLRINNLLKILPVFQKKLLILNNRNDIKINKKYLRDVCSASYLPVADFIPAIMGCDNFLKFGRQNSEIINMQPHILRLLDHIILP